MLSSKLLGLGLVRIIGIYASLGFFYIAPWEQADDVITFLPLPPNRLGWNEDFRVSDWLAVLLGINLGNVWFALAWDGNVLDIDEVLCKSES